MRDNLGSASRNHNNRPTADPGLGTKGNGRVSRIINPDGSFNVVRSRSGTPLFDLYEWLMATRWYKFMGFVFVFILIINLIFTIIYLWVGVQSLGGIEHLGAMHAFWKAFFFSLQTYTTVGYGAIHPNDWPSSAIASLEAIVGILSAAMATGLLYGRFAKPKLMIAFSENILITQKDNTLYLMFRIGNQRNNTLIEMEGNVMLMISKEENNQLNREYHALELEVNKINFLPLNWTIVHEINPNSPLWGLTPKEMQEKDAQFLILIKGFDDTYSQTIHSRYSYTTDHMVWGASFVRPFDVLENGKIHFDLDLLNTYDLHENPVESLKF